jgi:ABC-type multidrug transport system fused ATPase/permease subunit
VFIDVHVLFRTVYREAGVYLLDDPLSAVDAHVGQYLLQHCICEFLKDKTRVLITHQLQYLNMAENIIILDHVSVTSYSPQ